MAALKSDIIAEATRKLKTIIALSTLLQQSKIYFFALSINTIVGYCALIYSFYHFRDSPDDLAGLAYNFGLLNAVVVAGASGQAGKHKLIKMVDDTYCSYDYQSSIMKSKLNELEKPRAKALKGLFKTLLYLVCGTQFNLIGLTVIIGTIKKQEIYIFPCWHPFDMNNVLSQIGLLVWQQSIILSITFAAFGCWAMLFISYSHIKNEITLLQFALQNIESRAHEMVKTQKSLQTGMDNKILSACYNKCTIMCAEHHSKIISYFNNGKDYVGIFYTTAFVFGAESCTFGGYFISSDNRELQFKYLAMTLFILTYLYQIFWISEAITGKFLSIAETIYVTRWYNLPKESQSTLRLMQLRSNQPLFYKLILGQKVDMEAYMALVKATYYYLNILIQ